MKCRGGHHRAGFTVVELAIASSIVALVIGSLCSTIMGVQKLVSRSYTEAELSIRMRALREKILFHAAPPHDGKVFAGVLSGMTTSRSALPIEGGIKINVLAGSMKLSDGSSQDQNIQLVLENSSQGSSRKYFKNDGETGFQRLHWLRLENAGDGRTATANLGYLGENALVDDLLGTARRNLYFINLSAKLGDIERRERVVVPVFATEQVRNDNSVFHDNLLQ